MICVVSSLYHAKISNEYIVNSGIICHWFTGIRYLAPYQSLSAI